MNEEAAIMLVLLSTGSMFLATRPRNDVDVVSSLVLGKTSSARPLRFCSCMKKGERWFGRNRWGKEVHDEEEVRGNHSKCKKTTTASRRKNL